MAPSDTRDPAAPENTADAAGPSDDAAGDGAPRSRPTGLTAVRSLGWRTLALCVGVALLAAAVTFVAVLSVVGGDDGDADERPRATLEAAERAPDVVLERFDGEPLRLSDYRGQPLVVNFWGSWCVPCVEEMPDLQRVHQALGDRVAFLGVNVRDTPEAADAMVERTGVTYDLARDPDGELGRALDVANWPTTVLIDSDGTVVEVWRSEISAERLCDKVNQGLLQGQLTECV
ncbi:MAG: TlpA family protein disulfide reductase [Acidimicrobiales bacterium]|nr:TlpA family protein disulfide reductase [Acidimicrobiales bacterium]